MCGSNKLVIVKNTSALLVKNGTSIERNAYTPVTIVERLNRDFGKLSSAYILATGYGDADIWHLIDIGFFTINR